jgi:hypothetical protein
MLQTLLKDRFKLSFHRGMKELTADTLMTVKDAPKLKASAEVQPGESGDPSIKLIKPPPASLGSRLRAIESRSRISQTTCRRSCTGLSPTRPASPGSSTSTPRSSSTDEVADPSLPERDVSTRLYTDLVKALGLKLESQKARVEVLIVGGAERPGDN